jgi:two-component system, repressor protein LuxO
MKKSVLIYVVEDSVPSALLYQSYLDSLGYEVRIFHTGLDALEAMNEKSPDILIQDIQLPDISGLEILKEVTAAELPTKTIIITSETELNYAIDATRHGAFDFIEKPFSKDRLLVTVANALRESKLVNTVKAYSDAVDSEGYGDFIGSSPSMKLVYQIIKNVAPSNLWLMQIKMPQEIAVCMAVTKLIGSGDKVLAMNISMP